MLCGTCDFVHVTYFRDDFSACDAGKAGEFVAACLHREQGWWQLWEVPELRSCPGSGLNCFGVHIQLLCFSVFGTEQLNTAVKHWVTTTLHSSQSLKLL